MKVNLLQFYDWVYWGEQYSNVYGDYDLEFHQHQIKLDDFFFLHVNDWEENEDLEFVKPILLTEEILKLNGFITNNDHTLTGSKIYHRLCGKYEEYKVTVRLLNGWVKIESFDDRWYTLLDLSVQLRYVHELQHALRLCGLHELANNFKIE